MSFEIIYCVAVCRDNIAKMPRHAKMPRVYFHSKSATRCRRSQSKQLAATVVHYEMLIGKWKVTSKWDEMKLLIRFDCTMKPRNWEVKYTCVCVDWKLSNSHCQLLHKSLFYQLAFLLVSQNPYVCAKPKKRSVHANSLSVKWLNFTHEMCVIILLYTKSLPNA